MNFYRLPGELIAAASIPITATTTLVTKAVTDDIMWTKLIGPFGGLALSIIFLGIFLRKDAVARRDRLKTEAQLRADILAREKKDETRRKEEDEAQDRRHSETLNLQKENSHQLLELTKSSITAQAETAHAIQSLATKIEGK
jgi:hypothetical protein